jgi:hypothetical protein
MKKGIGTGKKKHQLYLCKLNEYKNLEILKPVFRFYYENRATEWNLLLQNFLNR